MVLRQPNFHESSLYKHSLLSLELFYKIFYFKWLYQVIWFLQGYFQGISATRNCNNNSVLSLKRLTFGQDCWHLNSPSARSSTTPSPFAFLKHSEDFNVVAVHNKFTTLLVVYCRESLLQLKFVTTMQHVKWIPF